MKIVHFLLHRPTWHKLPVMPCSYSTDYEADAVDRDTATLMQLTHTRCPQGVEVLKQKHGLATSRALIEQLPPRRRKRHIGRRFMSQIRRALGLTSYDPMRSIARRHMRRGRG